MDDERNLVNVVNPERVLASVFGSAGEPLLIVMASGDAPLIKWANRALCEALRADLVDLVGAPLDEVMSWHADRPALSELGRRDFPGVLTGRDGSLSGWEVSAMPTISDGHCFWVLAFRVPAAASGIEERLKASEARFRALSDHAPIGIMASSVGLRLGYVNQELSSLVTVPAEQLLGMGWTRYLAEGELEHVTNGLAEVLGGFESNISTRFVTPAGDERLVVIRAVPVQTPEDAAGFLSTVEDVTDRRALEQMMAWRATHDPLTGLRNRATLLDDVANAVSAATSDRQVALVFMDLDHFKHINDTYGHDVGDEVLTVAGERLRNAVRSGDSVFRYAGDEFIVVVRGVADAPEADLVASRLVDSVNHPASVKGFSVSISCSAGVAVGGRGSDPEQLLRNADAAMYEAKRAKRNSRIGTGR